MSVKSQFLDKLQTRQSAPASSVSKSQADIAEFHLKMTLLQEQMDAWLDGTGLNVERFSVSVRDLLAEVGAFDIDGIVLRVDDRAVKFTPVFLYGQSVTGCVDVTLHAEGGSTSLGRLFMRAGQFNDWRLTYPGASTLPGVHFDEGAFFGLILSLLP
ncbi:hypothetical protein [Enterobacter sp. JBIWA005]|uniref:hypothetical protein n=1 Tax=Enterobacter sp. JBIWA005 TaxID=2831891 RepID=UPI001CBE9632|nr:hypothetical protein [Enterobacter sp. JBIWA005]UAN30477.1 hypothetical protein KGP22_14680 [Enterobacter sp. JBIWA005]